MVELDRLLGDHSAKVQLVSISIDPDHDTVERLRSYARRTGNRGALFTGDPANSEEVQRAFDAWQGDKMHHEAVFLINRNPKRSNEWVRLTGLLTPNELLGELRRVAPDVPPALPPAQMH
jgi:protein SCO1/2